MDGYAYVVCKHIGDSNPNIELLLCWAHVRNKFRLASEVGKNPDASWFVEQIARLYMVEVENQALQGILYVCLPADYVRKRE